MKMTKKLEICLKHLNTVKSHIDNLEIILGYFPHHNRTTGHVKQFAKPITTQYVPIQKLGNVFLRAKTLCLLCYSISIVMMGF